MAKMNAALLGANRQTSIPIIKIWLWPILAFAFAATAALQPARATIAASILIDEATGRVISAYRPNAPHAPASLTKMMTLYMAFEALQQRRISLHSRVTVSYRAAAKQPSKLYLRAGQVVTVEQLILAMTVKSANDAAAAMGEFLAGGNESLFAQRMTARAHQLGMRSTRFSNASGLPGAAYTTAHDMALLARALHQRFPQYSGYFSRRYFQWGARTHRNTNRLLHARPEVTGMKTGYTRAAGFNLVATATYGGKKVILVVLGGRTSGQRYSHAESLLAMAGRGIPARGPAIVVAKTDDRSTDVKTKETARTDDDDDGDGDEDTTKAAATVAAKAPLVKKTQGFSLISPAAASTRTRIVDRRAARAVLRYGIQVGSFRNFAEAQSVAKKAYYSVPGAYRSGSTRIAVVKFGQGRKTHYAARLLGFNQSAASNTCRHLKRRGLRCQTMSYPVQAASVGSPARRAAFARKAARLAAAVKRDDDLGYGLQVGVYKTFATARRAGVAAHRKVDRSVRARTKVTVVRIKQHRRIVFAARIEGFRREARAERMCHRLDRRGYDCDTVAYEM